MQYIRPYSFGLMAGALQTFDSSGAHQMSPEGLLPNWHTGGCGQTLSLADSSSRLGDVVDAYVPRVDLYRVSSLLNFR